MSREDYSAEWWMAQDKNFDDFFKRFVTLISDQRVHWAAAVRRHGVITDDEVYGSTNGTRGGKTYECKRVVTRDIKVA